MASHALTSRFSRTCWSWIASPRMVGSARPRSAADGDALTLEVVMEQAERVPDDLVQVDGPPHRGFLAEQGAEPPDDLGGPLGVVHHVRQRLDHARP